MEIEAPYELEQKERLRESELEFRGEFYSLWVNQTMEKRFWVPEQFIDQQARKMCDG